MDPIICIFPNFYVIYYNMQKSTADSTDCRRHIQICHRLQLILKGLYEQLFGIADTGVKIDECSYGTQYHANQKLYDLAGIHGEAER